MSRDESLYLADIQESCEKVLRFTKGMTYKDFVHDDRILMQFYAIWKSSAKL